MICNAHGKPNCERCKGVPKKFGIVCDDYKLPFFRKLLNKEGFKFEVKNFSAKESLIQVFATAADVHRVHQITKQVEIDSKQSN